MRQESNSSYILGVSVSLVVHLLLAVITVVLLESGAAGASRPLEVFTVTIEGGESLGGVSQVPKDDKQTRKPHLGAVPLETPQAQSEPDTTDVEVTENEKTLEAPSVVEDPEKIIAAKKFEEAKKKKEIEIRKETERKKAEEKKAEEAKKKAEDVKKKAADDAKKKAEDDRKKQQADAVKQKRDREDRNKRLTEISNQLKSRYEGESANAGGTGFGAARIGGSGMGGGTLASVEKIAYANELQAHVKSGWRWLSSTARLKALVLVRILPTGQIQDVSIEQSSGSANFDDSVIRAVRKANPVPPPPAKFYSDFSVVRFWFDSHEQ